MKIVNRKAYYEFTILEDFVAGICLLGSEVKSIRNGNVNLIDCFAYVKDGEIWIKNMKVSRYKQVHSIQQHDENREKKILLKRREISKIEKLLQDNGTTIVPLEIFTQHNKIKVKIAVVKGRKKWDKKESIKKKEAERQIRGDFNINI